MALGALSSSSTASFANDGFYKAEESFIHPTASIAQSVTLGEGVKIGPYVIIQGNVSIGAHTRIHAYVSIGAPAQNIGTYDSLGSITIGCHNEIREYCSIHASKYPSGSTVIGDHCYIMAYTHIAHDVQLGNYVTLINNVNLGGHSEIGDRAILMANSATHQFCRVGSYAALAPYSGIRQDIPPYGLYNGQPARFSGLNLIGLKRAGFSSELRAQIKRTTNLFFKDNYSLEAFTKIIQRDDELQNNEEIAHFLSFVTYSITQGRGVSRRTSQSTF